MMKIRNEKECQTCLEKEVIKTIRNIMIEMLRVDDMFLTKIVVRIE